MNESSANSGSHHFIEIAIVCILAFEYPEAFRNLLVFGAVAMVSCFIIAVVFEAFVPVSKRKREAERRQKEEEEEDTYHRARCMRLRALKDAKDNFDWSQPGSFDAIEAAIEKFDWSKPDSLKKWRELSTG